MNAPSLPSAWPGLADRRTFIGGSDCAAIFGVSPFATPLDIYLKKRGEMPTTGREADAGKQRLFKRGKRAEPVAIDMLVEDRDIKVTKRSLPEAKNYYIDPEHPFIAAEIDFEWQVEQEQVDLFGLDRELLGTIQNGEVKSVDPRVAKAKYGEEGSDEVPIEYAAQAMHGLMVTDRQACMFAVLSGWDDLTIYMVVRDNATIKVMREKCVAFWNDHVLAGVPPEPVNLPDVYHLFNREADTKIEATPEIAQLVRDLVVAGQEANAAHERQEEAKFKLGCFMLGAEQMETPEKKGRHVLTLGGADLLTVQLQAQYRIDNALLKEKHPEIVAACSKKTTFFTFRPKRSTKK